MKPSKFLFEQVYLRDKLKGYEATLKELDKRFIEKKELIEFIDGHIRDGLFSGRNWRLIIKEYLAKDSKSEKED